MAGDVRHGYERAAHAPGVKEIIPVGDAWIRAMNSGVADRNPYDGIDAGKLDLWAYDGYHASVYGSYLEALVIFGSVTTKPSGARPPVARASVVKNTSSVRIATLKPSPLSPKSSGSPRRRDRRR